MANSVNSINTVLYKNLNYNFVSDFTPVIHVVRSPLFMLVHPAVPAKTVPEFIAYAKANPGKLAMASGGSGSTGHLAGELFMMRTGVRMISRAVSRQVGGAYRCARRPASGAVLDHRVGDVVRQSRHVTRARGDVSERLAGLPDIPPLDQFVSGYEVNGWSGLCVPNNTPGDIVTLLNTEINAALADPTIRARIADMGGVAPGGSPADFAKYIADEIGRWQKVVARGHKDADLTRSSCHPNTDIGGSEVPRCRRKVSIIVTAESAAVEAKRATSTIPIVLALANDPPAGGLVESLARPEERYQPIAPGSRDCEQTTGPLTRNFPGRPPPGDPDERRLSRCWSEPSHASLPSCGLRGPLSTTIQLT